MVFKLGASRKKPGTHEAIALSLVSLFDKDHSFLIDQFLQYRTANFRKALLKALPNDTVLSLFQKELSAFLSLSNDQELYELKKTINEFSSIEDTKFKDNLTQILSTWAKQYFNPKYQIQLWLDGTINDSPGDDIVENHFIKSEEQERLLILKRIEVSLSQKLVKKIIKPEEAEETLNFILTYLRQVNELSYYEDIKSKLYHREYWIGKKDYELFTGTAEYLKEILTEEQKLSLFFKGYLNSIPVEFVLSNSSELKKEEIEKLLESDLLSKAAAFKLIQNLLKKELNLYSSLERAAIQEPDNDKSEGDLGNYNETLAEPFYWIFRIAKKYLSDNKFLIIEDAVTQQPRIWLHYILWDKGYIKTAPENFLSNILISNQNLQQIIDGWLGKGRITKDKVCSILKSNITKLEDITDRKKFYVLFNHLKSLTTLGIDVTTIEENINQSNLWCSLP